MCGKYGLNGCLTQDLLDGRIRPMPKKPKNGTSPKVNKSAWIRSQPGTLSAAEVVSKAKQAGIKLSVAQVYTTRSEAKRKGPRAVTAAAPAAAGPGRPKTKLETAAGKDLRHEFVSIAVRIGTDEAQRLLDRIVDVQTPMRGSSAY
jgi:hypothetical protein